MDVRTCTLGAQGGCGDDSWVITLSAGSLRSGSALTSLILLSSEV